MKPSPASRDLGAFMATHHATLFRTPPGQLRQKAALADIALGLDLYTAVVLGKGASFEANLADINREMDFHAAYAAYFRSGWRHSADAICLRGLAQLSRDNDVEVRHLLIEVVYYPFLAHLGSWRLTVSCFARCIGRERHLIRAEDEDAQVADV